MRITSTTPVPDLLLAAQMSLRDVEPGEIFTVRDLFLGFEWNRIPMGWRSQLGTAFNAYATGDEGRKLMEDKGKNRQHQQQYLRK